MFIFFQKWKCFDGSLTAINSLLSPAQINVDKKVDYVNEFYIEVAYVAFKSGGRRLFILQGDPLNIGVKDSTSV